MPTVLEAMGQFLDWWIGLVIIVLLYYLFKFLFMFGDGGPTGSIEDIGKRIGETRDAFRRGKRAAFKTYRLDKELENILEKLERKVARRETPGLSSLLNECKDQLEKGGDLVSFLADAEQKILALADGKTKTKLQTIHGDILAKFDGVKKSYGAVENALKRTTPDWTTAKNKLVRCKAAVRKIARDIPALEAI